MPLSRDVAVSLRIALDRAGVPELLVDSLIRASDELADNYAAGHLRPAELNGSDFAEATFRILQHLSQGRYTPLNRSLPRVDNLLEQFERSQLDDSLRVHVPRVLNTIYDIRNRRGVAHLPAGVSANRSDAELVLTNAKWVIAELIRLFHTMTHEDAQRLVDTFAVTRPVLVEVFDGEPRIVARADLSLPQKVLVLLHWHEPDVPLREQLYEWLSDPNHRISTAIARLSARNQVHETAQQRIHLTQLGRDLARAVILEHSAN